jgi:hypothetical protein
VSPAEKKFISYLYRIGRHKTDNLAVCDGDGTGFQEVLAQQQVTASGIEIKPTQSCTNCHIGAPSSITGLR